MPHLSLKNIKVHNLFKKIFKKNRQRTLIEKKIKYSFDDPTILERALAHKSYAFSIANDNLKSNERLEFLGDAILGFIVSDYLFKKYPKKPEGELSKLKSLIISRKALREAADRIDLGEHILLSKAEEKTGGRDRFSINTNTFEALIAAIYLDGGFKKAKSFVYKYVLSLLREFINDKTFINYKSRLLEYVQSQDSNDMPKYDVVKEYGPDHNKTFEISVFFWGKVFGIGKGKTKKDAEQNAARVALEKLNNIEPNE